MDNETIISNFDALLRMATKFGFRFIIDLVFVITIIKFIYLKFYKNKDLVFTFIVFNIVIFSISFLLNRIELSLGAAFGLFAVFGMLRYKTEEITIKDMTYLFLNISLGVISAVLKIKGANEEYEYFFIIALNSLIFSLIFFLENNIFFQMEFSQTVNYDKIELIKPENTDLLINDLKQRTGLKIKRISIQKIDFNKEIVQIKLFYTL